MSAAGPQNGGLHNLKNGHLPAQREQTNGDVARGPSLQNPQTQAPDAPSRIPPDTAKVPTFLGNLDKVSKISQQLAVTRCLNSVTGGNNSPWKAYPGHNKLITLDMDINGSREADQFHSTPRENAEIKDWLEWRIQPDIDQIGRRSSKARLKLLVVTLAGGETVSPSATDDATVLHDVFDEWSFPTAALSVLLDRRATFMDQQIATNASKKASKRSATQINRVFCVGMRQWTMVWSPSPYDPPFGARGVIMCMDKTWASSVPGVVLQYLKTMWMFLGFQGVLPLIACMTSLRYAASALAEDDKEAFRREFELRSWLKGGFNAERKDLGYTSAQVSWLSSRVSRHRDRLMVTNRMLGILKEDLDIYEIFAPKDSFEILRNCICNLADMKEHLRSQARQLEAQANVQLAALFNLITQKDSATALLIAKTSQTIAADSRRDQKVSVDIANSSRLIAYNTLRDSASMKAIANVTMVFLPGTFMASVFAMPFFSSQKAAGFFVNGKIWIYVLITIPLTLATLACAWVWYHFSARSHRTLQGEDGEESPLHLHGGRLWMDPNQDQRSMPSPAEKNIGRLPYAQDEERLDDSSQVDVDFEQQDYNVDNFEHWDPMTREFAPSVFAASSFAFTEDSRSAKSIRSKAASIGSVAATIGSVAATIRSVAATVKLAEVAEPSRSEAATQEATQAGPSDRDTNKFKKRETEVKARMLERDTEVKASKREPLKQHVRDRDVARAREPKKSPRRVWVESDDSEPEAVIKSSSASSRRPKMEPRSSRSASPAASTLSRSREMPSYREYFSKPTTPTRGSFLKHADTPDSARDRDRYAHSMTRSYSDGAKAGEPTKTPQSRSPRGFRLEQPRQISSTSKTKYPVVEPLEDAMSSRRTGGLQEYDRQWRDWPSSLESRSEKREPYPPRRSNTAERTDRDRGRDSYQPSRARSGSGDSFKSRGSGHSHRGYSY